MENAKSQDIEHHIKKQRVCQWDEMNHRIVTSEEEEEYKNPGKIANQTINEEYTPIRQRIAPKIPIDEFVEEVFHNLHYN